VEVALNVAGRFAAHDASDALVLSVVEGADRLLPDFPAGMSAYATQRLHALGADILCGARVQAIDEGAVRLDTRRTLSSDVVLWATGSIGPALFEDAGLVCDEDGFARVTGTLQCMGHPRLFAAGDCATVAGHESLRKVGVHAVKQGPVLRTNLDRAISALRAGQPTHNWSLDSFAPYPVAPLILSTGTATGLWTAGSLWLQGRPFLRLKHLVDRRWIHAYSSHWQQTSPWQWIDAAAAATSTEPVRSGE
jgi:selenide,water dikinase